MQYMYNIEFIVTFIISLARANGNNIDITVGISIVKTYVTALLYESLGVIGKTQQLQMELSTALELYFTVEQRETIFRNLEVMVGRPVQNSCCLNIDYAHHNFDITVDTLYNLTIYVTTKELNLDTYLENNLIDIENTIEEGGWVDRKTREYYNALRKSKSW